MSNNVKLGAEILEELGIDLHPEHIARIGDYMIGASNKSYDLGFKDGIQAVRLYVGGFIEPSESPFYRPLYK